MVCVVVVTYKVTLFSDEWEDMCIVAIEANINVKINHQLVQDLLLSAGFTAPNDQVGVANDVGVVYPLTVGSILENTQYIIPSTTGGCGQCIAGTRRYTSLMYTIINCLVEPTDGDRNGGSDRLSDALNGSDHVNDALDGVSDGSDHVSDGSDGVSDGSSDDEGALTIVTGIILVYVPAIDVY